MINNKKPSAMIIVERTRKRVLRNIRHKLIPAGSFEKDYNGKRVHILGCDKAGKLWAISIPPVLSGRSPVDLYMAVHCADEVNEVYGLSMPMSEKIKLGIFAGLCIAILIVIFLIVASTGG